VSLFNEFDGRFASALRISLRDPEAELREENKILRQELALMRVENESLRNTIYRRRAPGRSRRERAERLSKGIAIGLAILVVGLASVVLWDVLLHA
jgi:hypothetical protein